jgi:putative lipase involved disintegration of autophagic bodies
MDRKVQEETMSYSYEKERERVFSDDGQRMVMQMHATARKCIEMSGAVRMDKLMSGLLGDSWLMMACADRLVEMGCIEEIKNPVSNVGQHRLFVAGEASY